MRKEEIKTREVNTEKTLKILKFFLESVGGASKLGKKVVGGATAATSVR